MRADRRLRELESRVSRAITGEPEEYCLECLGPGGYRLLLERERARLFALGWNGISSSPFPEELLAKLAQAEERSPAVLVCRGCGGDTYEGAFRRERATLGLP